MYKFIFFLLVLPFLGKGQDPDSLISEAARAIQEKKLDSAQYYFARAEALYLLAEDWDAYVSQTLELAAVMYTNRSFNAGIRLLLHADSTLSAKGIRHRDQQISINYQIARAYNFLRQPDACMEYLNKNLPDLDTNMLIFANHQNLLGLSHYKKKQQLKALECFDRALSIRIGQLGYQHDKVAGVFNNIGNAYSDLGLYGKALQNFNRSLEIRKNLPKPNGRKIAYVRANMGIMYKTKGEYPKAVQYLKEALAFFQSNATDNTYFISIIYNYLAQTYRYAGAYEEADAYHRKALELLQQASAAYVAETAAIYNDWGNLHRQTRDYTQRIALHEQSVSLYQQILEPSDPVLVIAIDNLGLAYLEAGHYDKALSRFKSIAPLLEKNKEQQNTLANIYNNIGDVYLQQAEPDILQAKKYHEKARDIQQQVSGKKSYALAYTYNSLATVAEREGEKEQALQYLQLALEANHADYSAGAPDETPAPDGFYRYDYFVNSLFHMAGLLAENGDRAARLRANSLYLLVDSTLNLVRNELIAAEDKIRLSEQFYELSQAAVANCIHLAELTGEQNYLEDAFVYAEKSKGNVIAQSKAASQARSFAGLPDTLVALEKQLQSDINFYKLQLADQPDSLKAKLFQNELFTAQAAYRELIDRLENNFPAYYQLKYDTRVPGVNSIQMTLPDSTALINYLISDSVLYSFVITSNEFSVHRSAINRSAFYDQQMAFRKAIIRKASWKYADLGHALYNLLFPFSLDAKIKQLVLVPDGSLNKLPFEALLSHAATTETKSFSDLHYLIRDYDLKYALSTGLYHRENRLPSGPAKRGEGLVAYAPVFAEPQDVSIFENELRSPLTGGAEAHLAATTADGSYLSSLPGTADEVSAIVEIFKKNNRPAESFLYAAASEQQIKQTGLSRSRYVHIATHGLVNEQQPNLSGLILYPDSSAQEDHILYSGEIYNLSLCADLVVLSACETGLGKVAGGEGLLGLSRAFFYAGADNLLVSLWKVDDLATAILMKAFYHHHLEDEKTGFTSALRQAKIEMIGSDTYSHPFFWSAFVLVD